MGAPGTPSSGARPVISVVVPCHNYGPYLPEALQSVLTQSRAADELVVIDDGSSDETAAVIQAFVSSHPSTIVLSRSPARGVVDTFNAGVLASSGQLVVILSADDRMSPNYLESLEMALADPRSSFAYASLHYFGTRSGTWIAPRFDPRRLSKSNFVNGSAMFRRDLFNAVGGFDKHFESIGMEDWAFWLGALDVGAVGVGVPECWLEYRRHNGASRNRMSIATVIDIHIAARRRFPSVVRRSDLLAGAMRDSVWWLRQQATGMSDGSNGRSRRPGADTQNTGRHQRQDGEPQT